MLALDCADDAAGLALLRTQQELFHELLAAIEGIPEVTEAGMSGAMPLVGSGNGRGASQTNFARPLAR